MHQFSKHFVYRKKTVGLPKKNILSLDYTVQNGLFFTSSTTWKDVLSFKTQQAIEKINPLAFFCFKNEPLILFFHNPADELSIHKLCWNFNKAPIIVFLRGKDVPISEDGNELVIKVNEKIEIFNSFHLNENTGLLRELENADIREFSYWNIVSGEIWEQYASQFKPENKVDYKLLKNIGDARMKLIQNIDSNDASLIANRILGRLIFVRYLIDRKVKINFSDRDYLSKEDLTQIILEKNQLYKLFYHLQDIFNGDLFPFVNSTQSNPNSSYEQDQLSNNSLELISRLFKGGDVISGQLSLFHIYDFSVIPIELVSNIYEYFMGAEKQDKNKAFYTPPFLVDYLVNETVDPFLRNQDTWHCTTLDPACGSGIFLVETLRRIILKYKSLNKHVATNNIKRFKYDIINILTHSIYGIDKDREALDVAIFSLYITLLDFIEEPKDIEGFRFPYLYGFNFFEADFFTTDFSENKSNDFVERLRRIKLDFIIGNPPWGKVKDSPYLDYAQQRLKNDPEEFARLKEKFSGQKGVRNTGIKLVGNNEIAQAFLLRTSDFANTDSTTCALLVTSKVLHNLQSNVFRNYFFNHVKAKKVVDFSAIRKHIFSKPKGAKNTIGPCVFIVYNWSNDNNLDNTVHHYSPKLNQLYRVFKILTIQKYDYKKFTQEKVIDYDWAWKVFLYGNVLDFDFILHLKTNYQTIREATSDSKKFIVRQGVILGGGDDNDASHLKDLPLIDTNTNIQSFYVEVSSKTRWFDSNKNPWDRQFAHRPKKELFEQGLFNGNVLLTRKGLNSDFKCISAFTTKKGVFRDSATGIKALNTEDIAFLKMLSAYLNSIYFSYYIYNTGSSTGIEREQVHNLEKFSLPIVENKTLAAFVDKITEVKSKIELLRSKSESKILGNKLKMDLDIEYLESIAKGVESEIEETIHKAFNFSDQEQSLIDYTREISIPLFMGGSEPFIKVDQGCLEKYVAVFEDYFGHIFNQQGKYFRIDIFQSHFMVGVQFSIVKNKPRKVFNYQEDKNQKKLLDILSVISFEQITDKVFIQKDVKIINKDSFCIIKPNEYKCWHEAVAYLDLNEFLPALIRPQQAKPQTN